MEPTALPTMQEQQGAFTSEKDQDWINRSRTLVVTSRGITPHQRKLILDIFNLLPHAKKQFKLEKDDVAEQISELCELHKCRSFLYFETKKRLRFAVWVGNYPYGPSFKFAMDETVGALFMNLQGNCLKGSRHVLSFDSTFQTNPVWRVARQLLTQALNVPLYHPRSKSVIDHVLSFTIQQNNVLSFKNYQIFKQIINKQKEKIKLFEIGPRFELEPICLLEGVMKGEVVYRNKMPARIDKKHKRPQHKSREKVPKKELPCEFSEEEFSGDQ